MLAGCPMTLKLVKHTGKEDSNGPPALAHILRCGKDEHLKRRVEGIDAVVEEFTERSALPCSSSEVRVGQMMP